MRISKKGFTLVELIATIAIIGVIMAISIVGVNVYIGKSEEKSSLISNSNVLSVAQIFVKEFYNNNHWTSTTVSDGVLSNHADSESTCVSIEQLISKGFLPKNIDKEKYKYVILERNKTTKAIISKALANSLENQFCYAITIENPKLVKKEVYTDHITAIYKISSEITEEELNISKGGYPRSINSYSVKLDDNNTICEKNEDEFICNNNNIKIIDKENYEPKLNENPFLKYIQVDIDQLTMNKEYEIELSVEYEIKRKYIDVNDEVVEGRYTQTFLSANKIKTQSINVPTIEYSKIDSDKKDITINIDASNIYDNEEFYINTEERSLVAKKLIVEETGYSEKNITLKLSDGTNYVEKEYTLDNYKCILEEKEEKIKLDIRNNNTPITGDVLKNFEIREPFNKNMEIDSVPGNILASVKIDAKTEISCDIFIESNDSSEDKLQLKIKRKSNNEEIDSSDLKNKWYSDDIIFNVSVLDKENVLSNNSYIVYELNEKSFSDVGNKKDIAVTENGINILNIYLKNKKTNDIISMQNFIVKIDKSSPTLESISIKKNNCIDDCDTNMEKDFKDNNKWKNYHINIDNYNAKDNYSNIVKLERTSYVNGSCSNTGVSEQTIPTYYQRDFNITLCFRAVDEAGNVSDWSVPYYFKIDTVAPEITIGAYKNTTGKDLTYNDINGLETYTTSWYNNRVFTRIENINNKSKDGVASNIYATRRQAYLYDDLVLDNKYYCNSDSECQKKYQNVVMEGIITLNYTVSDEAGNYTSKSIRVGIDTTPPVLTIGMSKTGNEVANSGHSLSTIKSALISNPTKYPVYTSNKPYDRNVIVYIDAYGDNLSGVSGAVCVSKNAVHGTSEQFHWYNINLKGLNKIICRVQDNAGNFKDYATYVNNTHEHEFGEYITEKSGAYKNYIIKPYEYVNNFRNDGDKLPSSGAWDYEWCSCHKEDPEYRHEYKHGKNAAFVTCIHCGKTSEELGLSSTAGIWWCPKDVNSKANKDLVYEGYVYVGY